MTQRKSYGQFCALARGLDVVGDRWALLVIRELLLGPRSFRELEQCLPGISPNLLSSRLRAMTKDGVIVRNSAPARSKAVLYTLTQTGESLEPVVFELIRWGARWMARGPGSDRVDPAWSLLALRALLEGAVADGRMQMVVHLAVDGSMLTIEVDRGFRSVRPDHEGDGDALISGSMSAVLAVAAGLRDIDAALAVVGDHTAATAALSPRIAEPAP